MNDSMSNKELIAVGHEFAKTLSSDTPIIDIAKMFTRLAERLDCTTAALREMTKQRDALAAENAGLKAGILQASEDMEAHHDDHGLFSYDADGEQMDALLRLCDAQDSIASLVNSETPATDAFMAEVRAQGVDMMVEQCELDFVFIEPEDEEHYTLMIEHAKEFAAQLRQGGAE